MPHLLISVLLLSSLGLASEKPNSWICDIKDELRPWPHPDEVEISLAEPTLNEIKYVLEDDGKYSTSKQELVSNETISSWKYDRKKCELKASFKSSEQEDRYDFSFRCGDRNIVGAFDLDFKTGKGSYFEQLIAYNLKRSFSLQNCRSR